LRLRAAQRAFAFPGAARGGGPFLLRFPLSLTKRKEEKVKFSKLWALVVLAVVLPIHAQVTTYWTVEEHQLPME
jgi:hypothetical protein